MCLFIFTKNEISYFCRIPKILNIEFRRTSKFFETLSSYKLKRRDDSAAQIKVTMAHLNIVFAKKKQK